MATAAAAAACLDDNQAAEFATGALAMGEAAKVEAHLAACRDCRSLVAALAGASGEDSDLATSPRAQPGHPGFNPTVPAHGGARVAAFSVGDRIGRYVVLGRLGQGGMGVVLSAYDPQLDRKVAIKLLRTGTGVATAEARARMVREAKAIAQLSHPNVVAVYDVGTADPGDVYIAMEFVEGDTLTAWQRRWDRPWREILDVFLQAGRGLAAAHGAGLLHRDFKPDNVLVGADGRVRVGDFGLARSVAGPDDRATPPVVAAALASSLTATGTIVGTPRYMAPETLRGRDSDARSDQFSFCVALYEALFGRHPLDGETAVLMIEGGKAAAPPPEGHKVPASIVRAVLRGLDELPTKRFPSMASLIVELTPPPVRQPRRMLVVAAAGVLVVGAAGAAVLSRSGGGDIPEGREQQLLNRIKALEDERGVLVAKLDNAIKDKEQVEQLRQEIKVKDQQIQELLVAASAEPPDLGDFPVATIKRPGKPPPDVGLQVVTALSTADTHLVGCFREWSERHPATDAHLTVRMMVSPKGISHTADAVGVDDSALPLCVADAVKGIPVPAPGVILRLTVDVDFVGGIITTEPHILAVDPDAGTIDTGPGRGNGSGLIDM